MSHVTKKRRLPIITKLFDCVFLSRRADHATPLYPRKLALNFVDKWRLLSRYISLADWGPRSLFCFCVTISHLVRANYNCAHARTHTHTGNTVCGLVRHVDWFIFTNMSLGTEDFFRISLGRTRQCALKLVKFEVKNGGYLRSLQHIARGLLNSFIN
jgi:hypothetical protein